MRQGPKLPLLTVLLLVTSGAVSASLLDDIHILVTRGVAALRGVNVAEPPRIPVPYTAKGQAQTGDHALYTDYTSNGDLSVLSLKTDPDTGDFGRSISSVKNKKAYSWGNPGGCISLTLPEELLGAGIGFPHGLNSCSTPGLPLHCTKSGDNEWTMRFKMPAQELEHEMKYTFDGDSLASMAIDIGDGEPPAVTTFYSFTATGDEALLVLPEECQDKDESHAPAPFSFISNMLPRRPTDVPPKVPVPYTAKTLIERPNSPVKVGMEYTFNGALSVVSFSTEEEGETGRSIASIRDGKRYYWSPNHCEPVEFPKGLAALGVGMPHGINSCGQPGIDCARHGDGEWVLTYRTTELRRTVVGTAKYVFEGDRLIAMSFIAQLGIEGPLMTFSSVEPAADDVVLTIPAECEGKRATQGFEASTRLVEPRFDSGRVV